MKSTLAATAVALFALPAFAAPLPLILHVDNIDDGKPIANKYAYCMADGKGHVTNGGNISPSIRWSNAPADTKSYALIVVDPDVPGSFELANQPGKVIPNDFTRQNFYHWVLVDIPASVTELEEGKDSKGVVEGGKTLGQTGYGISGQNDYGKMKPGNWGGYDGPCPPWNDERMHHYHFIVYALDVSTLNLATPVTGKQAQEAIASHVLARGELVGTYTTNPSLLGK